MNRTPRASLTISLLDDEDFDRLIETRGGMEVFGVFVCILIAGRERLGRDRAHRIGESDALRFEDGTAHVLKKAHVTPKQLERAIAMLAEVAQATRSKPWLYLDKEGRLVIKSFFKFNTSAGWGGSRDGAGRKSNGNQDDSQNNQVDSGPESSCGVTGAGNGTGNGTGADTDDSGASVPSRPKIVRPPTAELRENNGPGRDSPAAIALAKWAEQFGSDRTGDTYADYVRATCDYVPAEWLRALLKRKVDGATNKPNIALLRSIVKAWVETGECEFLVTPAASKPRDAPLPEPPPPAPFDPEAEAERLLIERKTREKHDRIHAEAAARRAARSNHR